MSSIACTRIERIICFFCLRFSLRKRIAIRCLDVPDAEPWTGSRVFCHARYLVAKCSGIGARAEYVDVPSGSIAGRSSISRTLHGLYRVVLFVNRPEENVSMRIPAGMIYMIVRDVKKIDVYTFIAHTLIGMDSPGDYRASDW
jgi:hypothetical protein